MGKDVECWMLDVGKKHGLSIGRMSFDDEFEGFMERAGFLRFFG